MLLTVAMIAISSIGLCIIFGCSIYNNTTCYLYSNHYFINDSQCPMLNYLQLLIILFILIKYVIINCYNFWNVANHLILYYLSLWMVLFVLILLTTNNWSMSTLQPNKVSSPWFCFLFKVVYDSKKYTLNVNIIWSFLDYNKGKREGKFKDIIIAI
jgi:hypothetical protein